MNKLGFDGMDLAPAASFELLLKAYQAARDSGIEVHVGGVLSGDTFYNDDPNWWKPWAEHGVLACDMETTALYTLAAKFKVNALAVLTVSDHILTKSEVTARQSEQGFSEMARIALEAVPSESRGQGGGTRRLPGRDVRLYGNDR